MVIPRVSLLAFCAVAIVIAMAARSQEALITSERSATLASLFTPEESAGLASTLPLDKPVKFRVWLAQSEKPGVLVFVSPTDSGEPQAGWLPVLQQKGLSWIAAEEFGNQEPSAQRVLAAMMALRLIQQSASADPKRTYIGGMSGGGRIASQTAPRFPQKFAGALYIVGADFWSPNDTRVAKRAAANRYVFITGERDFNRTEMRRVFSRYQSSGLTGSLLMDLPAFGHEYPINAQLAQAIEFLDAR